MTATKGCVCGMPRKRPTTQREVEILKRLRGHDIIMCVLCGHEIGPIVKARDVRDLYPFGDGNRFIHRACAKARNLPARARRRVRP